MSQSASTFNIIVLHPNNGSHISTKIVTPPPSNINSLFANGRYSNNLMLIHISFTLVSNGDSLILVNTDDWTVTTYISSSSRYLENYLPIFDTDQIMLMLADGFRGRYTVQTAYDKLHLTEFYSL